MCQKLEIAAIWILRVIGSLIFIALTLFAMLYTQYLPDYANGEIPVNIHDSVWRNLIALAAACIAFWVLFKLENRIPDRIQAWVRRLLLAALAVWIGVAGITWITVLDRTPVGDQAFIYGGASYFIEGKYWFLGKGAYCDMYPYQLGLIALVELLFRVVGTYNYFACQLINVGFIVGISILGYLLVRRMSKRFVASVFYCVLFFFCLPLIFYTGWVYGDIPSIFFMLLTAYCLLRYVEKGHLGWMVGMVTAVLFSILVRNNSKIMLVALCLTAGVYVLKKKNWMLLLGLVLSVSLPWLAYAGIYKMYEIRSGSEKLGGVPAISNVAMGMQENNGKCGWDTQYVKEVYWAAGNDTELASEASWQDVKDRLEVFLDNPSYACLFFGKKILSQWNQPLYQSLFFSAQYAEGQIPEPDSIDARVHGEYRLYILNMCDRLQFVLYFGLLCYFLFAVKKESNILQHMLAATIVGGFFFSIIWEAKARYILPYYIFMYPLAVIGLLQAVGRLEKLMVWIRARVSIGNERNRSEKGISLLHQCR